MDTLKNLAEAINTLDDKEKDQLNLHLADGGNHILRPLGDGPYEQCVKSHVGLCGQCAQDGTWIPCG